MSRRDVEAAAGKHGYKVSHSTVSKIARGHYSSPGERILVGLSVALDLPIERLREAAGVADPGTPFRLPEYAARLSPAERSAVEHIVRVMVEAKEQRKVGEGNAKRAPSNTQAGEDVPAHDEDWNEMDLAAHKGFKGEAPGQLHDDAP